MAAMHKNLHTFLVASAAIILWDAFRPRESRVDLPLLGRMIDSPIDGAQGKGLIDGIGAMFKKDTKAGA